MKYCIITLTCDDPLYNHFDDIKRAYLDKLGIRNIFLYNTTQPQEPKHKNDVIYVSNIGGPRGIYTMFDKFIHLLKTDESLSEYDHILRVNSSTFLNMPILDKYVENLPKTDCYAGPCTVPIGPKDFISGCCTVLSKDVINKLKQITQKQEYRQLEDDLIMFDFMKQSKIPLTNIPMYWYDTNIIPTENDLHEVLQKFPLIRVKNNKDRNKIDKTIWNMIKENVS